MTIQFEKLLPAEIEKRSFEIISKELGDRKIEKNQQPIVKRVIHTTADFDYADNLVFSDGAVEQALQAMKHGACIVTDTQMAKAGINKKALERLGIEVYNFIAEEEIAKSAIREGTTRSAVCMDKAAQLGKPVILVVGNAPTALIRISELVLQGSLKPELIIGTPVGFVNVVSSKERIMELSVPYIIAKGRKGGSNVAAAIVNALLYMLYER